MIGNANANQHNQFMLTEEMERFENLNTKFQRTKIIGRKNEVLRFLLELSGQGTHMDADS